jgi:hypothetical protein
MHIGVWRRIELEGRSLFCLEDARLQYCISKKVLNEFTVYVKEQHNLRVSQ